METNNSGPNPRALGDWMRLLYVRKSRQHLILGNVAFKRLLALTAADQPSQPRRGRDACPHAAPGSAPESLLRNALALPICRLGQNPRAMVGRR
jgi:hypothetical protein